MSSNLDHQDSQTIRFLKPQYLDELEPRSPDTCMMSFLANETDPDRAIRCQWLNPKLVGLPMGLNPKLAALTMGQAQRGSGNKKKPNTWVNLSEQKMPLGQLQDHIPITCRRSGVIPKFARPLDDRFQDH